MEIIKEDTYEEMAATYQCLEIARLNEVLKRHGITDVALRQQICSDYISDTGYFLDACWFKSGGKKLYPDLCFAERSAGERGHRGEIEKLHVRSDMFDFHDYAFGDIDWYFEEHNEDASEVETGDEYL